MNYLTTRSFVNQLDPNKKYCFILGAGASVSSGIPTGIGIINSWKNEIIEYASTLGIAYSEELIRRMEALNNKTQYIRFSDPDYIPNISSSLDDYNDFCDLRFLGDENAEIKWFFDLMNSAKPFFGYFALADILAKTKNNIVITTNFDELIENAITEYTNTKPFSIALEAASQYATESHTGRPHILKIHRDIMYGGYNRSTDTNSLRKEWVCPLTRILEEYIPIVIGYAGADNSLMNFLQTNMSKGIYWCHLQGELPIVNDRIIETLINKNGSFVEIIDFDDVMCKIADRLLNNHGRTLINDSSAIGYGIYNVFYPIKHSRYKKSGSEVRRLSTKQLSSVVTPVSLGSLIRCQIGVFFYKRKKYYRAEKWLISAYRHESLTGIHYGKAIYNLGCIYLKIGAYHDAEKAYELFFSKEDNEPGIETISLLAKNNYALACLLSGKLDKALDVAMDLLNYRQCDGDAHRIMATIHFLKNGVAQALQEIRIAKKCEELNNRRDSFLRNCLYEGILLLWDNNASLALNVFQKLARESDLNCQFKSLVDSCIGYAHEGLISLQDATDILLQRR